MRVLPLAASIPRHFNPSTAGAAARWFKVATLYVPGIIVWSWVAALYKPKSWGAQIRLRTTVNEAGR